MADFGAVLRALKDKGACAYREAWPANGYTAVLLLVGEPFPLLVMHDHEHGPFGVFAGGQTDLLADDWVIIE